MWLRGDPVNRLLLGLFRPRRPVILGCDVAGRVEAVGPGVQRLQPGDDVFGDLCLSGFGAFAEYVCAPEAILSVKPHTMTFVQAAALPHVGTLAYQGLYDAGDLPSRRSLLINGAGGRRYDLILDTRTRRSAFRLANALLAGGAYVTVGGLVRRLILIALTAPLIRGTSDRRLRIVAQKPNRDLPKLIEWFEAGIVDPVVHGPFPFDEAAWALSLFGRAGQQGKIIIEFP